MENITNITILENDILHKNNPLPDVLNNYIEIYKNIKFDVWQWFAQDTMQNKEKSIDRLKKLSQDDEHIFLAYPSFIGYDNNFAGWLYFLKQLSDEGIKLKLYLIFGSGEEDLLAYSLHFLQNEYGYDTYERDYKNLMSALQRHEIYYTTYDKSIMSPYESEDMFSIFKTLEYETLNKIFVKKGNYVRIKESGEVCRVIYSFYWRTLEASHVDVVLDEEKDEANNNLLNSEDMDKSAYKECKIHEIEKYDK